MNSNRSQPGEGAVVLREVTLADLQVFFEHQRDPAALEMAAFHSREREAFMAHWAKILADPAVIKKCIMFGDEVAGYVACYERSGRWLIGYWVGREFWGNGIATRGLVGFVSLVERRPLNAYVAQANIGSIRVLEKCGFVRIGEDRSPATDDSPCVDEYIYTLDGRD